MGAVGFAGDIDSCDSRAQTNHYRELAKDTACYGQYGKAFASTADLCAARCAETPGCTVFSYIPSDKWHNSTCRISFCGNPGAIHPHMKCGHTDGTVKTVVATQCG